MMEPSTFPSRETILHFLKYDPETGLFTWRVDAGRRAKAGSPAGHYTKKGGRLIGLNGGTYTASSLAWKITYGILPNGRISHKNGDNSDNSISNLIATSIPECIRRNKISKTNTTGIKGVHRHGKKFRVCIEKDKVKHFVPGLFENLHDAQKAALELREKLHGIHAIPR